MQRILIKEKNKMTTDEVPLEIANGSWSLLLLYVGIALGFSFVCSLLEASLLSASRSHAEAQAQAGSRAGRLMLKHKLDVQRPITAILTLNTIANTFGAANAGAEAALIFGSAFLGVISAVLTLLILIFSEIIPKTLGAVYWKALMPFTAYTLQGLMLVLFPFVWAFQYLGRLLQPEALEPTVTRVELTALASIGEAEGTLAARESRVLHNLLSLEATRIGDVMTPRTVVMALPETLTVGQVVTRHGVLPHSRLPVFDDDIDAVTGYVLRHDILNATAADRHDTPLTDLRHTVGVVTEHTTLANALERFVVEREHIFLVIDEFGGTAGIITLEDAIEALLGIEILDESDAHEDMRELAIQQMRLLNRDLQPVGYAPDHKAGYAVMTEIPSQ
jgi:CBS domain containing-hemolysin-like protein